MIELLKGDITKMLVDVIVNAANSSLLGGGGVDGAIHRAGGESILEECKKIIAKQGGCEAGEAVFTTAGNLPAKWVIHTVGPIWTGGGHNEKALLQNAYLNSLKLAAELKAESIAFPNISTGVYHFPKQDAAEIAIGAVKDFLNHPGSVQKVIFVCFDDQSFQIYQQILYPAPPSAASKHLV